MQGLAPHGYGWQHGDRGKAGTPSAAPGSPVVLTAGLQPPVVVTAAEAGAASGIKEGARRRRVSQREVGHRGGQRGLNMPVPSDGSVFLPVGRYTGFKMIYSFPSGFFFV